MDDESIQRNIDNLVDKLGTKSTVVCKKFSIGKKEFIWAAIIYINALVDKTLIDRDVLNPLMLHVDEKLKAYDGIGVYLSETYIPMSNTEVLKDVNKALTELKRGKTVVVIENSPEFIIIDTTAGEYRSITEPENESAVKSAREGFVEKLETNVALIRRKVKDETLTVEYIQIGRRSQTDVALMYISSITDDKLVNKVRNKMSLIDVDNLNATGLLEQYMGRNKYNIFPEFLASERPDKVLANLMEGRIAISIEGTPFVMTIPSFFTDFFQTVDDYFEKTILASSIRALRLFAVFVVISLDPLFMTLIKSNNEFIPLKFVIPIAQARIGIPLSIFIEIMLMEMVVEVLREGGIRLPSRIAQTLSVVGGIIIGDTAIRSKVVSPTTLFVVGITTIASFIIPNYDMSLAIRFLRFPMLLVSLFLGIFGIAVTWYFIFVYLCSLESFGIPYLSFNKSNINDQLYRGAIWELENRPEAVPNKDPIRQSDFRKEVENGDDDRDK